MNGLLVCLPLSLGGGGVVGMCFLGLGMASCTSMSVLRSGHGCGHE